MIETLSGVYCQFNLIHSELCRRFPWLTATPLGLDVDPEVYWRNAKVVESIVGSRHSSQSFSGIVSVASQRSERISGDMGSILSISRIASEVVKATFGLASRATASSLGRVLLSRAETGIGAVTAITPA